jgi:hypothetical protein
MSIANEAEGFYHFGLNVAQLGTKGQYGGREPEGTQRMDPAIKEKCGSNMLNFTEDIQ